MDAAPDRVDGDLHAHFRSAGRFDQHVLRHAGQQAMVADQHDLPCFDRGAHVVGIGADPDRLGVVAKFDQQRQRAFEVEVAQRRQVDILDGAALHQQRAREAAGGAGQGDADAPVRQFLEQQFVVHRRGFAAADQESAGAAARKSACDP